MNRGLVPYHNDKRIMIIILVVIIIVIMIMIIIVIMIIVMIIVMMIRTTTGKMTHVRPISVLRFWTSESGWLDF